MERRWESGAILEVGPTEPVGTLRAEGGRKMGAKVVVVCADVFLHENVLWLQCLQKGPPPFLYLYVQGRCSTPSSFLPSPNPLRLPPASFPLQKHCLSLRVIAIDFSSKCNLGKAGFLFLKHHLYIGKCDMGDDGFHRKLSHLGHGKTLNEPAVLGEDLGL